MSVELVSSLSPPGSARLKAPLLLLQTNVWTAPDSRPMPVLGSLSWQLYMWSLIGDTQSAHESE